MAISGIRRLRKLTKQVYKFLSLIWACVSRSKSIQERSSLIVKSHDVDVEVEGHVPESGPVIFVSNHVGYIDPIVISSIVEFIPIAKSEILKWPLIGSAMCRSGVIFYKRGNRSSGAAVLSKCIKLLNSNKNVLVFPEGTTTDGSTVLPFKRGIFGLSIKLDVPVIPIRIDLEDSSMAWWDEKTFVEHYKYFTSQEKIKIKVTFLPPQKSAPEETAEQFAERMRELIRNTSD